MNHKNKRAFDAGALKQWVQEPIFYVAVTVALFFAIAIPTSVNYITADEHFWLPNIGSERIVDYWTELLKGDFEDTYINDKPGITLAYFSGVALLFTQDIIDEQIIYKDDEITIYNPEITKQLNFAFRLPIILLTGFMAFYFYWILGKITGDRRVAALSVIFILLSPVILGISQIVNPDTMFWLFGAASLFTFIAYSQYRERRYMWLTMLLFGLTLASKYVGVIFFPFFLLIIGLSYIYGQKSIPEKASEFAKTVRKDILHYYSIILGAVFLLTVLMPAAYVDPEILYESTIGFPGMLPIFLVTVVITGLILGDSYFFKSSAVRWIVNTISPKKHYLEYALYGILLASSLFVLFNWLSKNSIVDLSDIPFYAKTKDSFTTDNPYWARYVREYVPLIFALSPITLFLMLLFWLRALFLENSRRFVTFILSLFFIVFYIAVIEQGLLVTVRYSIILFPLALVLAAIGLFDTFFTKTDKRHARWIWIISAGGVLLAAALMALVGYHQGQPVGTQIIIANIIGNFFFTIGILSLLVAGYIGWLLYKAFDRLKSRLGNWLKRITFPILAVFAILSSLPSLYAAYPHFFLYMNTLLHENYVLNLSWGYGGYEAAEFLNQLPDAENITLWADAHGVCEFFVGKCIREQKLDITKYKVDYMFQSFRAPISAKFETETGDSIWEYYPDGRDTNYIRIKKNDYEASLREMERKQQESAQ